MRQFNNDQDPGRRCATRWTAAAATGIPPPWCAIAPAPAPSTDRRARRELNGIAQRLQGLLRTIDCIWLQRDAVYVLLPEADRDAVEALMARAAARRVAGCCPPRAGRGVLPGGRADGQRAARPPCPRRRKGAIKLSPAAAWPGRRRPASSGPRRLIELVRCRGPSRRYLLPKRTFDVVLCVGAAAVCLPVLALCALAVRLDSPGPIVFSQLRTGRDGRRFRMYKFRTMVENAEELKASLAHLNMLPPPDFKIPNDPRDHARRAGSCARRASTSCRSCSTCCAATCRSSARGRPRSRRRPTTSWHTHRLDVPPGLTGLWQVEGRDTMTFDERLRLDVQYIRARVASRTTSSCWPVPCAWSRAARERDHGAPGERHGRRSRRARRCTTPSPRPLGVLDRAGVRWCLLRGAQDLDRVDGDVDLLVSRPELGRLRHALVASGGLSPLSSWGRRPHHFYVGRRGR